MLHVYVLYFFVICMIGVFSLGVTSVAYLKTKDRFIRDYLFFYSNFTLSVLLNAFFSYIDVNLPLLSDKVIFALSYLDILLVHLLMFSVPFFIHTFFQVPRQRLRNIIAATFSIGLYIVYHLWATVTLITEKNLEENHIDFSDYGMTLMLLYCFATVVRHYRPIADPVRKQLARRFLLSFGILLPFIFYDIIVTMMFSPIFFLILSLLFNHHFITHSLHGPRNSEEEGDPEQKKNAGTGIEELAAKYTLSPREQEVLLLLLQGLTNQNIGERLFISPNTVKTHISNIYQKIGVNRRYELLALCKDLQFPSAPTEEDAS